MPTVPQGYPGDAVTERPGRCGWRWSRRIPWSPSWGEGPDDEGSHLSTSHIVVGAESVVGRRVAALGNPSSRDLVDCILEHGAVVVDELVQVGRRQLQGASQERRHLTTGDRVVTAVAPVAAAHGQTSFEEAAGRALIERAVVVVEIVGPRGGSAKARARKMAISPRVTGSFGQNRVLAGGLQP